MSEKFRRNYRILIFAVKENFVKCSSVLYFWFFVDNKKKVNTKLHFVAIGQKIQKKSFSTFFFFTEDAKLTSFEKYTIGTPSSNCTLAKKNIIYVKTEISFKNALSFQ